VALMLRIAGASLLGWPLWASVGAHAMGIAAASSIVAFAPAAPAPEPAPIEVVRVEPPPPPPEPPKPRRRAETTPPRRVAEPRAQPQEVAAPNLLTDTPRREPSPAIAEPSDASRIVAGTHSSGWTIPGAPGSGARGTGKLFSTGDLPLPGAREGAGSGRAEGPTVASLGDAAGLTSLAHPLGGYQTKPRYPDSARRQGVEGESVLRFEVLASGRVGTITVSRSAGHPDLDRAAVDAVRTWLFEPARRGKEAVAVWVILPIRFQLQSGIVE
jgi:protein TonB